MDHDIPDLRVERIPQDGGDGRKAENDQVEDEEDYGEDREGFVVEGDGDEEEGDDSCAHRRAKPGGGEVSDDATPATVMFG